MQRKSYYEGKANKGQVVVKAEEERKENSPKYIVELNVGGEVFELPLWQNEKEWGDKTIAIDLNKWKPLLRALMTEMLDSTPQSSNNGGSCKQDVLPGHIKEDTTEEFGF